MKTLNKIFAGMLIASVAFGFFGCSDEEEDENLVVEISVSGTDSDSSRTVTLTKPAGYEDKDVQIIYTLDETTPDVTFNKDNYQAGTAQEVAEYIDYGTASLYDSPIKIESTVTIKAYAFYIDTTNQKCVKSGDWSTKKVTVTSSTTSTEATGDSTGTFTFNLASTGNSNTVHYFDTSASNVFKLNDAYPNAYYQTQFSWKGSGKGNWYLYMRDANKGLVKEGGVTSFVAKGTYTGNCFNASNGSVANGDLELFDSDGADRGSITISNQNQFTMKVTNTATNSVTSTSVSVGDAK